MKILVLDLDGVVNSRRSSVALGGRPHDFTPYDMARFDHVALGLLRRLCRITDCAVLLSSSWRFHFTAQQVANALDLPIVASTGSRHATRGEEIAAKLSEYPACTHYAIVDDLEAGQNPPMLPEQQPHFVQTDDDLGLTLANYERLFFILTDPDMAIA